MSQAPLSTTQPPHLDLRWEGYSHETLGVKRNLCRRQEEAANSPIQVSHVCLNEADGDQTSAVKKKTQRNLQLFARSLCPVTEIYVIAMKNNIIIFTPPDNRQGIGSHGSWIRIEKEGGARLIESLLVIWLGAWALFAGIEFLQSTGILVF